MAHEDRTPSLLIAERDGRVLVHCFGGYEQHSVIEALRARGLWPDRERRQWTPAERRAWAREQRATEKDLPAARYWKCAVIAIAEETLVLLKAAFFDRASESDVSGADLESVTRELARLQRLAGAALVAEFSSWRRRDPVLTDAMVREARLRELAAVRAMFRYFQVLDSEAMA